MPSPHDPALWQQPLLGYCTNVHPGSDLVTTREQLEQHATRVRQRLGWEEMGVGLWLSRRTADELMADVGSVPAFAEWLADRGLRPYTLNGFPFGDFHQRVVKHQVYLPTWADEERWEYTRDLAHLLTALLQHSCSNPGGSDTRGTISTLPLGWVDAAATLGEVEWLRRAVQNLGRIAIELEQIESATGIRLEVCLEPEPGCWLGSMPPMLEFFCDHLLAGQEIERQRHLRYLSICYDICHAGVMHESAADNLCGLRSAGIRIGKVQVSSALEIDFEALNEPQRGSAWARLQAFSEPRYLHQTMVYLAGQEARYFADLPLALADPTVAQRGCWTVHFHVPISEQYAGELGTTQAAIGQFINQVHAQQWWPTHWEVETYAWNVLPAELQSADLADGIARELRTLEQWLAAPSAGRGN